MADGTKLQTTKTGDATDPYYDLIMNEDLANSRWPEIIDKHKQNKKQSLMVQVMTKAVFDKLKDLTTENGWTIARAINTGTLYPNSLVGCHAGDFESYRIFKDLFNPVIEKYHTGYLLDGSMKHVNDMDPAMLQEDISDEARKCIVSTRIRCARNLIMFPLNTTGSLQTRLEIADMMETVFQRLGCKETTKDLSGTFVRHSDMTADQEAQLISDHLLFRGKDKLQAASGYHQYWPHGRGIFVSNDRRFLVWINEGDHLRIISIDQGGDVKGVLSRLHRSVTAIEILLKDISSRDDVFVNDSILGMITCCPSNLGTGLRASVHCRLPKLIKKFGLEKIDEFVRPMHCQVRGSMGEHSEVTDYLDVSNLRRLGHTEYDLTQDMIKCVNYLVEMETELQ